MDSKGRPTKLEDIITAESLLEMLIKLPEMVRDHGSPKQFRDQPSHSNTITKIICNYLHTDKLEETILLMAVATVGDPARLVCAWMMIILMAIDEAIKQRAEVDELREMADR